MNKFADLHIHTNYSDSTDSPSDVVKKAEAAKLDAIAITDHDTLEGVVPTKDAACGTDLEVIAGVELSTDHNGKDMHILGYFVDCNDGPLLQTLTQAQDGRISRVKEMIDKLEELGITGIDEEEVRSLAKSKSVGRPHLATIMKEKGIVSSIQQAFDKYLAEGKPAYVPKFKVSPFDAIQLIKASGGVAVMAHPLVTNRDELIPKLVEAGLDGIEVFYPTHPQSAVQYYTKIAEKYKLALTGGSDAHGDAKQHTDVGKVKIPYKYIEELKSRANGKK